MAKWVYNFGDGSAEGNRDMKDLLGGKGANLAEMANLNLPVPSGFTITTEVCTYFYDTDYSYPADLEKQVVKGMQRVESQMKALFGDDRDPLLVSVRSGARVSMPGMMDTVLNLGLNDVTVKGLAQKSGCERFAYDSYRRFIQMYSDVVLGLDHYEFEEIIEQYKREEGLAEDTDIEAAGWRLIIQKFKALVESDTGKAFPDDPWVQLWGAIGAVFQSWQTPRARTYRQIHNIPQSWGTAVNIQAMVFGNMGDDCATGVAFTRDPSTGENSLYGEYLVNAQGEDVVAGIRTPQSITIAGKEREGSQLPAMEEVMPSVFHELMRVRAQLEKHYRDMQDIEFTVQNGKLFMLQTRSGKRTAKAALQIAVDMVEQGLISQEEAVLRVDALALDQLLHPTLDPKAKKDVLTKGLPASPGAASGQIIFTADEAEKQAGDRDVILVRIETSPEDIHGMHAAKGILTSRGGMTSHAAVVARGMGRPCVAGAGAIDIDLKSKTMRIGGQEFAQGDVITIDGTTGEVIKGRVPTVSPDLSDTFDKLMGWADAHRRMKIRTNADTPEDCVTARNFGAEGIGLCRTEHMFFDAERIQRVREMIFADSYEARENALTFLEPYQREDFVGIFTAMQGLPVTIRLLDPPLHEFLPHEQSDILAFAKKADLDEKQVRYRLEQLREANPMLGHRGCRLGLSYPEIYDMQVRAIISAALDVKAKGEAVLPEIMIPLVGTKQELEILRRRAETVAEEILADRQVRLDYMIGTMIELPRAALCADQIAEEADFFSFGTNDLTQTALGISRDDAGRFLPAYASQGIYERDPFSTLDVDGVGQLIRIACEKGRAAKPDIKLGICGEHGGDPDSIAFCETQGLDYVSCSPYRVPIARLAAAQAALKSAPAKSSKKNSKAA